MMKFLSEFEANLGIRIQCSREFEPLGTAGPLALAKDKLIDGSGQPIFVLSSDVICEFPLKEMLEFHKSCCAEASVMVTRSSLCQTRGSEIHHQWLQILQLDSHRKCGRSRGFGESEREG